MRNTTPSLTALVICTKQNPSRPGATLVYVRCPYCGGEHQHGVPEGETIAGQHRIGHCQLDERPGMQRKTREQLARARELIARHGGGYTIKEDGNA